MPLKTLSARFAIISLAFMLVGCPGQPVEPEISICSLDAVINGDGSINFEESKMFCISDLNPNDPTKEKKIPLIEYLNGKPIMTKVDDYARKTKWGELLKVWGKAHCK